MSPLVVPVSPAEHEACPATELLRRVGDKWTPLLLSLLADGERGFNELDRSVTGLSRRMLTRTLRSLECDGLIQRTAPERPGDRSVYALTPLGHSFRVQLLALAEWAVTHADEMSAARARFTD